VHIKKVGKDKIIKNIVKELEMKEELCKVDIIIMQALEAILDKIILDQIKE